MEIRYVASRILDDGRYIYERWEDQLPLDIFTPDISTTERKGREMICHWALHKYIEDFMRVWFTTASTCKKGTHAKNKFYKAFIKNQDEEVENKLIDMWIEAEREIKNDRATEKINRKINKEKSTHLKVETRWGIINTGLDINYMEYNISLLEEDLKKKKNKLANKKQIYEQHLHQRGAFILPEVCKELWKVYQESKEVHGEKLFNNPSNNTIRIVQALRCVTNPDVF